MPESVTELNVERQLQDPKLRGRMEGRLPIIVVVRLAYSWGADRYSVGVKFEDGPFTWPIMQRYARL